MRPALRKAPPHSAIRQTGRLKISQQIATSVPLSAPFEHLGNAPVSFLFFDSFRCWIYHKSPQRNTPDPGEFVSSARRFDIVDFSCGCPYRQKSLQQMIVTGCPDAARIEVRNHLLHRTALGISLPALVLLLNSAAPGSASAKEKTHIVKKGDSIARIADYYGVSQRDLKDANGIGRGSVIDIGDRLFIPDVLRGGAGNDIAKGGQGADILLGSGGADTLVGGDDRDLIIGGQRADTAQVRNNNDRDQAQRQRRHSLSGRVV